MQNFVEPRYCLNCGKEIPRGKLKPCKYKKRNFCSKSCASQYNNNNKNKLYIKRQSIKKKPKFCLNCGNELQNKQTKYCCQKCQVDYQQKQWEEKWFSGEISGFSETDHWGNIPDRIRTYLFNKYDSKCSKCGWGEVNPFTGRVPLEVEHIDGDFTNNRPENVTLLCPNCHSLTATYRGANSGKGRRKTWTPIDYKKIKENSSNKNQKST